MREHQFEGVPVQGELACGEFRSDAFWETDIVALKDGGGDDESDHVHHLGTHAGPFAGAERDEGCGLLQGSVHDESLRLEFERLVPLHLVVQEDDGTFAHVIA